jgi:hypothetical protein
VNISGFVLEKDYKKVIEKLIGERPSAGVIVKNKIQFVKERAANFINQYREEKS